MAVYDYRAFRYNGAWWAARVVTKLSPGPATESVFFTNLKEGDESNRAAMIPAGWLNRMSYRSLVRCLEGAAVCSGSWPVGRHNTPDPEDYVELRYTDDEGLLWALNRTRAIRLLHGEPTLLPAIELVCLDDSVLRKEVVLDADDTFDAAVAQLGEENVVRSLVAAVKGTFPDLPQ